MSRQAPDALTGLGVLERDSVDNRSAFRLAPGFTAVHRTDGRQQRLASIELDEHIHQRAIRLDEELIDGFALVRRPIIDRAERFEGLAAVCRASEYSPQFGSG